MQRDIKGKRNFNEDIMLNTNRIFYMFMNNHSEAIRLTKQSFVDFSFNLRRLNSISNYIVDLKVAEEAGIKLVLSGTPNTIVKPDIGYLTLIQLYLLRIIYMTANADAYKYYEDDMLDQVNIFKGVRNALRMVKFHTEDEILIRTVNDLLKGKFGLYGKRHDYDIIKTRDSLSDSRKFNTVDDNSLAHIFNGYIPMTKESWFTSVELMENLGWKRFTSVYKGFEESITIKDEDLISHLYHRWNTGISSIEDINQLNNNSRMERKIEKFEYLIKPLDFDAGSFGKSVGLQQYMVANVYGMITDPLNKDAKYDERLVDLLEIAKMVKNYLRVSKDKHTYKRYDTITLLSNQVMFRQYISYIKGDFEFMFNKNPINGEKLRGENRFYIKTSKESEGSIELKDVCMKTYNIIRNAFRNKFKHRKFVDAHEDFIPLSEYVMMEFVIRRVLERGHTEETKHFNKLIKTMIRELAILSELDLVTVKHDLK